MGRIRFKSALSWEKGGEVSLLSKVSLMGEESLAEMTHQKGERVTGSFKA